MSKFFAEGNNSSDNSDQEENPSQNIPNKNRYQYDEDSNYHEEKRLVLNEKEKKNKIFKDLSNNAIKAVNIRDFDTVWDILQKLKKEIAKAEKWIEKEGYPPIFLRALKTINDDVMSITAEEIKKLKSTKSFKTLRQKLKSEIIPEYAEELENFKDDIIEESSSSEEKISSESSQSDSEIYKKYLHSDDPMQRRKYWLKRDKKAEKKEDESEEEKKPKKRETGTVKPKYHLVEVEKKKKLKIEDAEQAKARIMKILSEYARLHSQEKREEYLQNLDVIVKESQKYKDFEKLSILLADIPIRLQVTRQMKYTHFPRQNWKKIFNNLKKVHELLRESEEEDLAEQIIHFDDSSESKNTVAMTQESVYKLLKTYIMNLQRELQKAFTFLENGESQYRLWIQELLKFVDFMYKIGSEMSSKEELEKESAEVIFKVVENMYFMSGSFIQKINSGNEFQFAMISNLQEYATSILKHLSQEKVTKTILYLVYNHAVNRRDRGKDLLLISNILQTINSCDHYTQACFNRALAQIGVSSFCQGNLHETQHFLSDLCGYGKAKDQNKEVMKELLGQHQITEKEIPKSKPLPYYLHLNLNLLEGVELIASMLIEIPYILSEGGRITSKTLKRVFNEYEKSHFIAQPLNYRDLVYAASNDLKLGNWKQCFDHLMEAPIWTSLDNLSTVHTNLLSNIKQSSLHCYLVGNQKCFRCVSLKGLAEKFELEPNCVRKLIFRWIQQRELHATISEDGYLTMIHKRQQKESSLQLNADKLSLKLEEINKINEEMLSQHVDMPAEEDEEADKDAKFRRRISPAITEKLKAILSRRG